jgi:hypothetical protein
MTIPALNNDELVKLRDLISKGTATLQEIDDLRDGLKDVVANVADELNINKKSLSDAIRLNYKLIRDSAAIEDKKEALSEIEEIIEVYNGRTVHK